MSKTTFLLLFYFFFIQMSWAQENYFSEMSDVELKAYFTKKTEERVNDLGRNIKAISNKEIDEDLRKEYVQATISYFESEENIFEVSSVNRPNQPPRGIPIRDYLLRLMKLPYQNVEIEWFKTKWISNIRQSPDGKYRGVVKIYQSFKGRGLDGANDYIDITEKKIEVIIEVLDMDLGDEVKQIFSVLLGDVSVVATR